MKVENIFAKYKLLRNIKTASSVIEKLIGIRKVNQTNK